MVAITKSKEPDVVRQRVRQATMHAIPQDPYLKDGVFHETVPFLFCLRERAIRLLNLREPYFLQ